MDFYHNKKVSLKIQHIFGLVNNFDLLIRDYTFSASYFFFSQVSKKLLVFVRKVIMKLSLYINELYLSL